MEHRGREEWMATQHLVSRHHECLVGFILPLEMVEPRSLYIASESEHDAHAQSRRANPDARPNPPSIRVDTPANPYERRLRRKTREDRYEPKGNPEVEKTLPDKAVRKKKILRKRNGSCRIGERFCAENVRSGRLTVSGIFLR